MKKEKLFLKTKWFLWHWNHESSAWIIMVKILLLFKLIKFCSSLILFNPTLVCVRNDALFCWFWDHLQRLLRNLCLSKLSSCVKSRSNSLPFHNTDTHTHHTHTYTHTQLITTWNSSLSLTFHRYTNYAFQFLPKYSAAIFSCGGVSSCNTLRTYKVTSFLFVTIFFYVQFMHHRLMKLKIIISLVLELNWVHGCSNSWEKHMASAGKME